MMRANQPPPKGAPEDAGASPCRWSAPARRGVRASTLLKQLCQVVVVASLAMASYLVISHYLVQSVEVVGVSMVPTLADSRHYLLNKWIYHLRQPRHSEVVVLRDPADNGYSVKRIIATAGESVFLKEGKVYVNGKELTEPYLRPGTPTYPGARFHDQLILCGRDQYFVLGDNRMNSADSRVYGPVSRRNILGVVVP